MSITQNVCLYCHKEFKKIAPNLLPNIHFTCYSASNVQPASINCLPLSIMYKIKLLTTMNILHTVKQWTASQFFTSDAQQFLVFFLKWNVGFLFSLQDILKWLKIHSYTFSIHEESITLITWSNWTVSRKKRT